MSLRPGVDTASRAMTPLGATATAARFDAAVLAPTPSARLRLVLTAGRQAEAETGLGPREMLRKSMERLFPQPLSKMTDAKIDELVATVGSLVSAQKLAKAKAELIALRDEFRAKAAKAKAATKGTVSFAGRRLGGYDSVELADLDAVDTGEPVCNHGSEQDRKECNQVRDGFWIMWFLSLLFGS
jgi:parvulin-like peptidyl-prolyl isomerase